MLQVLHRILHALKKRGKHGLVVRHIPTCVFEEEPMNLSICHSMVS